MKWKEKKKLKMFSISRDYAYAEYPETKHYDGILKSIPQDRSTKIKTISVLRALAEVAKSVLEEQGYEVELQLRKG